VTLMAKVLVGSIMGADQRHVGAIYTPAVQEIGVGEHFSHRASSLAFGAGFPVTQAARKFCCFFDRAVGGGVGSASGWVEETPCPGMTESAPLSGEVL
jgi:hypothetical protein